MWYEYYVRCEGADVEVWRREKGSTDAMVKVLETDSATQTAAGYFTYASGTGNYLDDIVLLALNGGTLETEVSTYNAANELTSLTADGATTNFAYDQFGRMTQKTRGSETATYYYHYGDKLTKVASNFKGEGTVTYTVGGDQKRRSRAVSGGDTTKYRYGAGWDVLNEEDGSGTLLRTRFGGLAISAGTSAATGTWAYYFTDALGSTRSLWDQDGDRIGKYEYTPFGGKYADSGNDVTRKFTGHDWDREARLYSTAYRFYSPDSNRWLTRDPLGMVDGPNVYAYVVNNPVTYSDPLGMFSLGNVMSGIRIGYNILSSAMDVWNAFDTFLDPCASGWEKTGAAAQAIAGVFLTGEKSIGSGLRIAALGDNAAGLIKRLDPKTIRFTQDSIGSKFKDGRKVSDLIADLRANPNHSVSPIRVFERNGITYSLDNRRLYAYQQAGVPITVQYVGPEEVAKAAWKFTAENGGTSIRVRGGGL